MRLIPSQRAGAMMSAGFRHPPGVMYPAVTPGDRRLSLEDPHPYRL